MAISNQIEAHQYRLTAVIWEEEHGFVSKAPELGVASAGDSIKEALDNLKEAVELYLENAAELGFLESLETSLKSEKYTTTFEV